jgi:hypothetical protein
LDSELQGLINLSPARLSELVESLVPGHHQNACTDYEACRWAVHEISELGNWAMVVYMEALRALTRPVPENLGFAIANASIEFKCAAMVWVMMKNKSQQASGGEPPPVI